MKTYTVQSITIKDPAYVNSNLVRLLEVEGPFTCFKVMDTEGNLREVALKVTPTGIFNYTRWDDGFFDGPICSKGKTIKADLKRWEKVQRNYLDASLDELAE